MMDSKKEPDKSTSDKSGVLDDEGEEATGETPGVKEGATGNSPIQNGTDSDRYALYGARPKVYTQAGTETTGSHSVDEQRALYNRSEVKRKTDTEQNDASLSTEQSDTENAGSASKTSLDDTGDSDTLDLEVEYPNQEPSTTCITTANSTTKSIIVHTNYFPKHMHTMAHSNSVFDSPDDSMNNVVDFIEADIARVYLHSSNSSRGSSTGDLCDITSNASPLPHYNMDGERALHNESDQRERDRPSTGSRSENCVTRLQAASEKLARNTGLVIKTNNTVPNSSSRHSTSSLENKPGVDYLDLDLDGDIQYSPEFLPSTSSDSNFQYGMMDDRGSLSADMEMGYNTDTSYSESGMAVGDSKSGDKTDCESNSDEAPFSDSYGTIKAKDYRNKKDRGDPRHDTPPGGCPNNLDDSSMTWGNESSEDLFNVSRQTSTSNFDQDENSYQDQEADGGLKLVCTVDPVKKANRRSLPNPPMHIPEGSPGISSSMNMESDPILNASWRMAQDSNGMDSFLFPFDIRNNSTRSRRAVSLEEADLLSNGSSQTSHTVDRKEDSSKLPNNNLFCKSLDYSDSSRLEPMNSSVDRVGSYSLPLLPPSGNLLHHMVRGLTHGEGPSGVLNGHDFDFREGLADLHLATQEQWDEYMALTRSLSTSRSFNGRPRNNVSVVRPLSPPFASTSNTGSGGPDLVNRAKDDSQKSSDAHTDLLILHLMREREQDGNGDKVVPSGSGGIDKVMIWSEYEAYLLQVKQIGTSACGATAVINILKALNIQLDKDMVCAAIHTKLRAETAALPQYLLSRSVAGTTAHDLIDGVRRLTHGKVQGRFFDFHPRRAVDIREWMAHWIRKGAVPLLTLNLQRAVPTGWQVPDAWHHQMAYGVSTKGVYLTNPLELVPANVLHEQLCSDSVLLVRRQDVLAHWSDTCDLSVLLRHPDTRWQKMNVIGQVVNVMREQHMPKATGYRPNRTSHIKIPAVYRSGITLYANTDSDVCKELMETRDLPLRQERFMETAV